MSDVARCHVCGAVVCVYLGSRRLAPHYTVVAGEPKPSVTCAGSLMEAA